MILKKCWLSAQNAVICALIFYNFSNVKAFIGPLIRQAEVNEFPFIAAITARTPILDIERDTLCTAAIISMQDVLTAEHCLFDEVENGIRIVVGSIDILSYSRYYPSWWITYDQWAIPKGIRNGCRLNDISIIKLTRNVNAGIIFGELSYLSYSDLRNLTTIGVGWGEANDHTCPRMLQVATNLRVLPLSECLDRGYRYTGETVYLDTNFFCTVGDPLALLMDGDSGGPLVYMNKIVAIHSGTYPKEREDLDPQKLNLHTRVDYYEDFINNFMDE